MELHQQFAVVVCFIVISLTLKQIIYFEMLFLYINILILPLSVKNFIIDYQNQENWGNIFEDCNFHLNQFQSPIEITQDFEQCKVGSSAVVMFEDISQQYQMKGSRLTISYKHSIINFLENNISSLFQSSHIHFHNIGEHKILGSLPDLEIHINYKVIKQNPNRKQKLYQHLILAIPIKINIQTQGDSFFSQLSPFQLQQSHLTNFNTLFKNISQQGFYKYEGSLTTPPCLTKVIWLVSDQWINISQKTGKIWRAIINKGLLNNRKMVALNDRKVTYLSKECLNNKI